MWINRRWQLPPTPFLFLPFSFTTFPFNCLHLSTRITSAVQFACRTYIPPPRTGRCRNFYYLRLIDSAFSLAPYHTTLPTATLAAVVVCWFRLYIYRFSLPCRFLRTRRTRTLVCFCAGGTARPFFPIPLAVPFCRLPRSRWDCPTSIAVWMVSTGGFLPTYTSRAYVRGARHNTRFLVSAFWRFLYTTANNAVATSLVQFGSARRQPTYLPTRPPYHHAAIPHTTFRSRLFKTGFVPVPDDCSVDVYPHILHGVPLSSVGCLVRPSVGPCTATTRTTVHPPGWFSTHNYTYNLPSYRDVGPVFVWTFWRFRTTRRCAMPFAVVMAGFVPVGLIRFTAADIRCTFPPFFWLDSLCRLV